MGLCITGYGRLSKVENAALDKYGYPVNWESEWKCQGLDAFNLTFPGVAPRLENNVVYTFSASFTFDAGSYGNYCEWLTDLAILAGYKDDMDCWENHTNGPFWELIAFSNVEGIIGAAISAKLAKDFEAFHNKAAALDEYFFGKYANCEMAFQIAADDGAVVFG